MILNQQINQFVYHHVSGETLFTTYGRNQTSWLTLKLPWKFS